MRLLNYSTIRRSTQADLRKYERIGVKMFTDALKLQAVPNPSPLPMQDAYVKFYQVVFVESAKKEYNRIRQDNREKNFVPDSFFLNTWREWIKDWVISNLGQLIFDVNANTDKQIKEIIAQGLENGLNPFQIQELLTDLIPNQARARAIARTESTRGYNEGKKRSAQDWANQTGTNLWKIWIHGGAKEPRIEHIELQDKPIRADQPFLVGPSKIAMDKPGDYEGGAGQTVNCGCVVVYVSESYARRNFPNTFTAGPVPPNIAPTGSVSIIPINLGRDIAADVDTFRIAKTLAEAKEISKNLINTNTVLKVNSTKFGDNLTLDQLNRYNQQIDKLSKEYNLSPHLDGKSQISLQFASSKKSYGFVEWDTQKLNTINFGDKSDSTNRTVERVRVFNPFSRSFAAKSKVDPNNVEIATVTHEFAHVISIENPAIFAKYPQMEMFWKEVKSLMTKYRKDIKLKSTQNDWQGLNDIFLGNYANTNRDEFFAESFTEYKLSSNPSKYAVEMGKIIDRYFKR